MITRNALRAITLASACLVPMVALAQTPPTPPPGASASTGPTIVIGGMPFWGEIEAGLLGVTGDNPNVYGRYLGTNTDGLDTVLNFNFTGRSPWFSGDTQYYEVEGNNLVFQTGNRLGYGLSTDNSWESSVSNHLINEGTLGFRAGDQGTWDLAGDYSAITYTGNVIDSPYTVSGHTASLNAPLLTYGGASCLVGPKCTAGSVTTFGVFNSGTTPGLLTSGAILPVQVGTRRDTISGNFDYHWGNWTFTGAISHTHKEGSVEESYYGTYGGTPFALPVNFDFERYDATAAYNTRLFQGSLQYTFNHFTDNNLFITLPYFVSRTAAPFEQAAAYSTPPSNEAHYVTLMLASNAIPNTRLNLNARVGVEKQDDTFAPNTADPGGLNLSGATLTGLNSALQGTSANSPDIVATIYQIKVSANSAPLPQFDVRGWYGVDGRSVSLNQRAVFGSGTGSDSSPGSATPYAFVVPQDWTKQNFGGEVGYVILPESETKLTAGYRGDFIDRSNAQVGHSYTNTASVQLLSNIGPNVDGQLTVDYIDRSGKVQYLGPWSFLTEAPTFSGAYYQAPMTSEGVTARADYHPWTNLSASFYASFRNEDYSYSGIPPGIAGLASSAIPLTGVGQGLKRDYTLTLGPDVTWRPVSQVNVHLFYTFERLYYDFHGNGACATPADIAAVAGTTSSCGSSPFLGYNNDESTSDTHTIGVSGEWNVSNKLKLKGDYTFSYGSVFYTMFNGVFVPFTPTQSYQNVSNYPDIDTRMHTVRLTATYSLTPGIELVGEASYSYFKDTDWNDTASPVQGAGSNTISFLTPGYSAPTYSVATVFGAVKFKFGAPPTLPPLVAAATPAPMVQAARSYLVFFDWDKATLTDRARQIIKQAAVNSTRVQYTRIEVNGYTDSSGTPQYNMGLSIRRADAVRAELIKDGVPANAISTKGFGETHQLVPTGAGVREPQNRRVEIVIT